jgi:hypothetical protein
MQEGAGGRFLAATIFTVTGLHSCSGPLQGHDMRLETTAGFAGSSAGLERWWRVRAAENVGNLGSNLGNDVNACDANLSVRDRTSLIVRDEAAKYASNIPPVVQPGSACPTGLSGVWFAGAHL